MKRFTQILVFICVGSSILACLELYDVYGPKPATWEITAYCPCEKCCGRFADGITASGVNVKDFYGLLIAAPPEYPFGTIMDVPGYGIATVQDRGGAIKGNKLDVFFPTHQEALEWGRQYLKVKIYEAEK